MKEMISWKAALKTTTFFFCLLFFVSLSYALPFTIVPKAGTTLPTVIAPGTSVTAYYTVINNTVSFRYNNFVKYLPPGVFQLTAGGTYPDTCGILFSLPSGGSCTLQLTVTAPVDATDPDPHHHLFVCFPGGLTCAGTSFPLSVVLGPPVLVSIAVIPTNATIVDGSTLQYTATGTFSDGTTLNITNSVLWSSSNTAVASINSTTGLATAVNPGSTTITALSAGVSGSTLLTVIPPPALVSIAVTPVNATITEGSTQQYTATGTFSDGSTQDITTSVSWTSTNTAVATIGPTTGLATAINSGTTTITATSGAISGSTPLTVIEPILQSITVTPEDSTILVGQTQQFTATGHYSNGTTQDITMSVSWSSSNPAVATITAFGLATGISPGTTSISATQGVITGATNLTVTTALPIGVAAGQDNTAGTTLLVKTLNGGSTWSVQTTPFAPFGKSKNKHLAITGFFNGASCSGNSVNGVCIAVGIDSSTNSPLLVKSLDAGVTWSVQTIPGIPANGTFFSGNCSGTDGTGVCIAAGQDLTGTTPPLLVASTDGGANWSVVTVPLAPANGSYFGTTCSGNNTTGVCVAVGRDLVTNQALLVKSLDGGTTWTRETGIVLPASSLLENTSCTSSGITGVCVAAGVDFTFVSPLLIQSMNGGLSWSTVSVPGSPAAGFFESSSCTGSGATAICITVGQNLTPGPPLIVQTVNGGANWTVPTITGNPASGIYNAATCAGSGATAVCIAAGQSTQGTNPPLLAETLDGGTTWNVITITGAPASGRFEAASCSGSGPGELCIAAGTNQDDSSPLLVQSTDGGLTWSIPTIPGLPATGDFFGASASNNLMPAWWKEKQFGEVFRKSL